MCNKEVHLLVIRT